MLEEAFVSSMVATSASDAPILDADGPTLEVLYAAKSVEPLFVTLCTTLSLNLLFNLSRQPVPVGFFANILIWINGGKSTGGM